MADQPNNDNEIQDAINDIEKCLNDNHFHELKALKNGIKFLKMENEIKIMENKNQIQAKEKQILKLENKIKDNAMQLKDKDHQIQAKENQILKLGNEIKDNAKQLKDKDILIQDKENQIKANTDQILKLENENKLLKMKTNDVEEESGPNDETQKDVLNDSYKETDDLLTNGTEKFFFGKSGHLV